MVVSMHAHGRGTDPENEGKPSMCGNMKEAR